MENMPGMNMTPPPPSPSDNIRNQHQSSHNMSMTSSSSSMAMSHMTFFWGKDAEILFSGWPGARGGMYALALIFVFILCVVLEWLNNCRWVRRGNTYGGRVVVRTLLHGVRVGLGYLVMLALMSFNVGVLIVAILGHVLGYFVFGSSVFFEAGGDGERSKDNNVLPANC